MAMPFDYQRGPMPPQAQGWGGANPRRNPLGTAPPVDAPQPGPVPAMPLGPPPGGPPDAGMPGQRVGWGGGAVPPGQAQQQQALNQNRQQVDQSFLDQHAGAGRFGQHGGQPQPGQSQQWKPPVNASPGPTPSAGTAPMAPNAGNAPSAPGADMPKPTQSQGSDSYGGQTFAQGGVVNQPTTAIIGEDGPEMVVPLSGRRDAKVSPRNLPGMNYTRG